MLPQTGVLVNTQFIFGAWSTFAAQLVCAEHGVRTANVGPPIPQTGVLVNTQFIFGAWSTFAAHGKPCFRRGKAVRFIRLSLAAQALVSP